MSEELDGTDRLIYMTWELSVSGLAFKVQEMPKRGKVNLLLVSGSTMATPGDLGAIIRVLQQAKDRLEKLSAVDAMDRIVVS